MTRLRTVEGHPRRINLSGRPVPGIGGLSLIALGTLVVMVSPQLLWAAVSLILAGSALGVGLFLVRRRDGLHATER